MTAETSAPVVPDEDKRAWIAAALLFTTQPTDRALKGWCGTGEACGVLAWLSVRTGGEVAWL